VKSTKSGDSAKRQGAVAGLGGRISRWKGGDSSE
jgi:hypothetical protein